MPIFHSKIDQYLDDSGDPIVNGKAYFGVFGQDSITQPITIYSDEELTIPLAQPQRTDSFGRLENDVYVGVDHSFEIRSTDDVLLHGPKSRRLSARTNVGIADGLSKLSAIEQSANVYELDEGFAAAPPSAMYLMTFDVPSTDYPEINFANIAGEFPSTGVQQVKAGRLYHTCFDGNSWEIIDDDASDDVDLILNGADLANCYQDSKRPAKKTVFDGKLGVLFAGVSSVHPMLYGVFVPKIGAVYNIVATFQPTTSITGKQKSITARFVDSRPSDGDGIIGTVTKDNVDIPDDPDEFQEIFERVIDSTMITSVVEGRFEIEVENASNFNHTGDLFMSRVEIQEVDV
ncbi:MAG: hypothetical protein ACRBEE_05880 [Arenicella sp.]